MYVSSTRVVASTWSVNQFRSTRVEDRLPGVPRRASPSRAWLKGVQNEERAARTTGLTRWVHRGRRPCSSKRAPLWPASQSLGAHVNAAR